MKTFLAPLSPEDEAICLKRLADGQLEARDELVLHNMRLVAHVVKRYQGSEEDSEDLIAIGTIGLLKAVNSFNSDFGSRFATYAIRCIDNEILMYFRSKKRTRSEVSLFEPIGTDKEGNQIHLVDVLEVEEKDVVNLVHKREQIDRLIKGMQDTLTKREYWIIKHRYGLQGETEKTQRQLAGELGISRSYVSRIEKKALLKLKKLVEQA